jgi:3-deoxy-manno-octulosonate cytidylyltransferase (CMP-KDO synthetase)
VLRRNATRSVPLFYEFFQNISVEGGATFLPKNRTCAVLHRHAKINCGVLMQVDAAIAIIPARYNSTRFPGKPIVEIDGKPLIEHVYRRVQQAKLVDRIVVATDDRRIADAVQRFGGTAVMTRNDHRSGTDRLAEAAKDLKDDTLIVNVQGDEPMIEPSDIDQAIAAARLGGAEMVTLMTRLDQAEADDPNRVKVVTDRAGIALYFSRSKIPHGGTCSLHLGLYVYRVDFLKKFTKLEPAPLEIAERLEQLRALEYGYRIRVVRVQSESWGIDTPEDLEKFRKRQGWGN